MSDLTQLLHNIDEGDPSASEKLLPLVYEELRKLASAKMANERKDHTLQSTALVHEAYVRLVNVPEAQHWNSRGHFFTAAAEAMRRILVEQARRKRGPTAGGGLQQIEMSAELPQIVDIDCDLLDLNTALEELEAQDVRSAHVLKLRFFAGLTREEVAQTIGVSISTVDDDWAYAKNWLRIALSR